MNMKYNKKENKRYLQDQKNLYWGSNFLDKKWYRKIYGGNWRLLKFVLGQKWEMNVGVVIKKS
jgi:hypothetical protein